MYNNIFFFLFLKYLKNNTNFIIMLSANLKIDKILKKRIISLSLILKDLLKNNIFFFNKKGNLLTSLDIAFNTSKSEKNDTLNYTLNSPLVGLNNKKLKFNTTNNFFTNYYSFYILFFNLIVLKNKHFFNNFFYNLTSKKGEKIAILNFYNLKKNFLKISFLIVNILYLNYNPYIITDKAQNNILSNLNIYLQLTNNYFKYGLIFCTSPYIQLKKVFNAKKKNIPLISVADLNTNTKWIDYPLIIDKSTKINSFFFFCFIVNVFFSLLIFKKKKYMNLYSNYKNLNYLKEFILKNEYSAVK